MIRSAQEFVKLRTSEKQEDYLRAANESAKTSVWFEVIDTYPEMKRWVAHNKTVPLEVLHKLARDADPNVRAFVASKNKLTPDLMKLLREDEDASVRQRIAYNKKADDETLGFLANDSEISVSEAAQARLSDRKQ